MRSIVSACIREWVPFIAVKLCLSSAVIVLQGVRVLGHIGLVGPDGFALALRWSERLVQSGMRTWRAERARAATKSREPE
jgi:hypothetical protein